MGTHRFVIDGKRYEVEVGSRDGDRIDVTVNGRKLGVVLESAPTGAAVASVQGLAPTPALSAPRSVPPPRAAGNGAGEVRAPMAGLVLAIRVAAGEKVSVGAELLVLEAMKMENAITAHLDGVVTSIAVQVKQTVGQGDLLVTIERT